MNPETLLIHIKDAKYFLKEAINADTTFLDDVRSELENALNAIDDAINEATALLGERQS